MYRVGSEPYFDKVRPADKAIQRLMQMATKYNICVRRAAMKEDIGGDSEHTDGGDKSVKI